MCDNALLWFWTGPPDTRFLDGLCGSTAGRFTGPYLHELVNSLSALSSFLIVSSHERVFNKGATCLKAS